MNLHWKLSDYERYIGSRDWARKRKDRLEMDEHRCRLCDEDGTRFQLEVHHRPSSYLKIPFESVKNDLITLCSRCHALITDAIREDRYGRRTVEVEIMEAFNQTRQEINHGMEHSSVSFDLIRTVDSTQRPDGRPDQQVGQVDQADLIKASEDRRRL